MKTSTTSSICSWSIAILTLIIICGCCLATVLTISKTKPTQTTIVFVGDILLDRGVLNVITQQGTDALFTKSIRSLFAKQDIVIGNLECPTTTIHQPLYKKFCFRADPKQLPILKKSGITHLTMANNHTMDQGREGMKDTYENIEKNKLTALGYGPTMQQACAPHLLIKYPRPIYLFSSVFVTSENWVHLETAPSICEYRIPRIVQQIQELKTRQNDAFIIVQLHWGVEHRTTPTFDQVRDARALIDAGADGIIGHHPHVIQPLQTYKGKPIYFSIGNFIFDQNAPVNKKALAIQFTIKTNTFRHKAYPLQIHNSIPQLQLE